MWFLFFIVPTFFAAYFFFRFIKGKYSSSPLWLWLSVWAIAIAVPRLSLSTLETPWSLGFYLSILISLVSFILGFFVFDKLFTKYPFWKKISWLNTEAFSTKRLQYAIYVLFGLSFLGLWMFYSRVHNFPLLADSPDVFRFEADEKVPGLINYIAQLARVAIPLSFFLMFSERFNWKKHWALVILCIFGAVALTLFASRTQIFFIDLWIMALYFLMRKPNLKQTLKFYPIFLLVSVIVLAAVPVIRQSKSYGGDYLGDITGIDSSKYIKGTKYILPIYVGISFNMQALLHAQTYYATHQLQHGKVTLDPFTNIVGLHQFKSNYDLGAIFYSWWNTGTYLFPFVQDFGDAAFAIIPFLIAGFLTLAWKYWKSSPNFLSINYYAYACFFIVMSIYLSFTVRAEMYIDLFLLFILYLIVRSKEPKLV
jgi:oligosaccharide repeat unit polymerase